jgi:hypothetical protein
MCIKHKKGPILPKVWPVANPKGFSWPWLLFWLVSVVPSMVRRGQLTNICNDFVCFYICDLLITLVWGLLICCCKMPTMLVSSFICKPLGVWKKKLRWTSTHIGILIFVCEAFSWMCQHGMECEELSRPFFFDFIFILQVQSVSGVTRTAKQSLFQNMLLL